LRFRLSDSGQIGGQASQKLLEIRAEADVVAIPSHTRLDVVREDILTGLSQAFQPLLPLGRTRNRLLVLDRVPLGMTSQKTRS